MKELMKKELNQITALIEELQASLAILPKGTFYSVRNGKYTKWFQYTNGQCILIRKSDKSFARALAKATFLRIRLKEAEEEQSAIKAYLRNCSKISSEIFLDKHEEIRDLLDQGLSLPESVQQWANAPYQKSDKPYKGTLYKTLKGDLVKSRAEKEIADTLFLAGIPYRYECAISFDGGRTFYYPDFTIMDPRTGRIILWEHFGMEDLNYYRHSNADKLYTYFEAGYIPGNSLICTSSSEENPLTPAKIQETIDYYFR